MENQEFGENPTFLSIALSPTVRLTAARIALLVGSVLCVINHAPDLMRGSFNSINLLQIMLTYAVPYCVSTFSSVKMIRKYVAGS